VTTKIFIKATVIITIFSFIFGKTSFTTSSLE